MSDRETGGRVFLKPNLEIRFSKPSEAWRQVQCHIEAKNARIAKLEAALEKIIEMNRQTAFAKDGDQNKAEHWACVRTAREALKD